MWWNIILKHGFLEISSGSNVVGYIKSTFFRKQLQMLDKISEIHLDESLEKDQSSQALRGQNPREKETTLL